MPDIFQPVSQKPYTPPSLAQRISAAINAGLLAFRTQELPSKEPDVRAAPDIYPTTQDDTPAGKGLPDANYIQSYYRQYNELVSSGGLSRRRRYQEYDAMDSGQIESQLDYIVNTCLIADDGQVNGFNVEAKTKTENVLNDVISASKLQFLIREIFRDYLKYGDSFVGYVFDQNYNIVDFDTPHPAQMWVFVDEHMRLLSGTERLIVGGKEYNIPVAYQQKNDAMQTMAGWYPFEMVHLKYAPKKRLVYSEKSFLEGLRRDWYKMRMVDEALVAHRVTRSSPRLAHTIDVTGKSQPEAEETVRSYMEALNDKRLSDGQEARDTIAVDEDYFFTAQYRVGEGGKLYPSLNEVKLFDPRNTGLNQLPDVEYFNKKLFSRVPAEAVGLLPDRNDISTQDIAASKMFFYFQEVLRTQLLKPIFDTALLLKGFKPDSDSYRVIFPDVKLRTSWRFADSQFRQSMADANAIETGIATRKQVAMQRNGWTEQQWEEHVRQYKKEENEFVAPEQATNIKGSNSNKIDMVRKGNNSQ